MRATARRGFTLIELLVVIAIFIALAAMIAVAAPKFGERQGPTRGAAQLQTWLNLARQMAIRDQRPRGIRILVPAGGALAEANYSRELQYIEQPADFTPMPIGGRSNVSVPAKLNDTTVLPLGYGGNRAPNYQWVKITEADPYSTTPPMSIPYLPTNPNVIDPNPNGQVGTRLIDRDAQAPVQI